MRTQRQRLLGWLAGAVFTLTIVGTTAAQTAPQAELQKWRAEREAKLTADDGWLTVAGLFWLKEGSNTIGTATTNQIVLPDGSAPARVGEFELHGDKAVFRAAEGVRATLNDQVVREVEVKSDEVKKPDALKVADLTFLLLKRGERYAIRLKDKNAETRRRFAGLDWYAPKTEYRVTAKFIPYEQPREVNIVNILGDVEKMRAPGQVVFTLNGREHNLEPVTTGESGRLFFIFHDLTSGKTTYPPGRFLYADAPKDGVVTLDFNQAINPPCAFTAYATCPLPPQRNHLSVAVEAGERKYNDPTRAHSYEAAGTAQLR